MKIIVSIGKNGEIGRAGDLAWHISADLKHFKEVTMGSPVIMGRKTWESLPKRPLPGRQNIVLTRCEGYEAPGAVVVSDLRKALQIAEGDPFVIGGAQVYAEALPAADTLYITEIDATDDRADAFFPPLPSTWQITEASPWHTTPSGLRYRFTTLKASPNPLPQEGAASPNPLPQEGA